MSGVLCERCGRSAAVVRVSAGNETPRRLCADCLRRRLADSGGARQADVARFLALFMPSRRRGGLILPVLPAGARCDRCGLRYDEFAAGGLAGCDGCYVAFAAAILPALEMLHGEEAGTA